MRKVSPVILLLVTVLVFNSAADAQPAKTEDGSQAAKIKATLQKRGVGEKSKVKVRLRTKEEVKGYISRIEDTSFNLTDSKTGQSTTIQFVNVEKVQGPGLSTGAKIGITAGVAVAIVAIVFAAEFKAHGY
jgi:hypothetical protein